MIKDRTEYLRGLADGMGLAEDDSKYARLFRAIIDCLGEMADSVDENTEMIDSINDDINDIFDTMDVYDEILFDDDEEDDDDGRCEGCECEGDCDDCDCEDDCDLCTCGDCDCDECCGGEDCDPKVECCNCGEKISLSELLICPKCHKPVFGGADDETEE